jgi:site-specific recombinase XerC
VQHGGDIESLRRLLGHNSLNTTQIYLNFDFQYMRQVYDRLYAKPDERRLFS